MKLENKVALITGAGSGIGKEAALLCAQEGARVVVADLDQASAESVTREIEQGGGKAHPIKADVSLAKDCQTIVSETAEIFGGLDILLNNAGIPMPKPLDALSEEDWDQTMAINLRSVFLCTKFAVPKMTDRGGGAIVNTSSMVASTGSRGQSAYCVSKAGVISFTQCMALELSAVNIRVNCICPGFTDTPMLRNFLSKWFPDKEERGKVIQDTEAKALLNRYGTPQEMAKAALFLASDDASFITGQALMVDGGTSINIL
jgi:NAD(P)-dependent dehydrogenase (short-subunit alcohol dehydrogenase family)